MLRWEINRQLVLFLTSKNSHSLFETKPEVSKTSGFSSLRYNLPVKSQGDPTSLNWQNIFEKKII
jgi:hypothetical protein